MQELPPGFRFYPTEEELVSFYLVNKLEGKREEINRVINVIDIYSIEPWDLPSTINTHHLAFSWILSFLVLGKGGKKKCFEVSFI